MPSGPTNTSQISGLNKRLDKSEAAIEVMQGDISGLKQSAASMTAEVASIARTQHESAGKLDQLLARGVASESVKGMVPTGSLLWGIGTFIALVSVGFTMLRSFEDNITKEIGHDSEKSELARQKVYRMIEDNAQAIRDQDTYLQREMRDLDEIGTTRLNELDKYLQMEFGSADTLTGQKIEALRTEMDLRVRAVADDVAENTEHLASRNGARFNAADHDDFMQRDFLPVRDKVDRLMEAHSGMVERVNNALDAINHHQRTLDHPQRQTYQLQDLKETIDKIGDEQQRRSARVWGDDNKAGPPAPEPHSH